MDASDELKVLEHLNHIEKSRAFDGAETSRAVLRFIVEEALAGRQPTEIIIAVGCLGKKTSLYDPKKDRSISGLVGKIRSRLANYYASEGKNDLVVISIPKKSFVAEFDFRSLQLPTLRPKPTVISIDPLAPAGLYRTKVAVAPTEVLVGTWGASYTDLLNHLFLPRLFAPWLLYGGKKVFVTAYDWPVRRIPNIDWPEFSKQIARIYRGNEWPDERDEEVPLSADSQAYKLPPDTLRLAQQQGRFVHVDYNTDAKYVFVNLEHLFPSHAIVPDDVWEDWGDEWVELPEERKASFYPSIDCYVWFEQDHIAFCPITAYRGH